MYMLTIDQSREYNRFKKLKTFFDGQTTVIATYVPFHTEVTGFNNNFATLEGFIPDKNATGTGITTNKTDLKHSVADRLAIICTTTKAYALKYDSQQLAAEMNFRANEMFKLKDADFLPFVLHMQSLITPLIVDVNYTPYGVTNEMIAGIVTDAQIFNNLIGLADVETSGNTVADENINAAIKALQNNVVQFDLLVDNFLAINPGFVSGYHINSAADNTGVRHSGIEGVVTANGQAVAGAVIKLADTTKTATTDLYGHYSLIRVSTGDYSIEVHAPGFASKTFVVHINRGRVSTLDFELQAAA
jgi:hypothetical protein